jgi:apolipoprotein D and lipocalin family protein
MKYIKFLVCCCCVFFLTACIETPKDVNAVKEFELQKYLGKWYEIARLDHSFERGLSQVTADYSLRKDGGVKVINRGYSEQKKAWKESEGKAYFVEQPNIGHLKVSFFGPFYGAYVIFELDKENYQYALVSGPDKSYLWVLSRTPELPQDVKTKLIQKAQNLGFNTQKLIFVKQI